MTRVTVAIVFALLLVSSGMNFFFGYALGSNAEITALSVASVNQLLTFAGAVIVQFVVIIALFVVVMPGEKLPNLPTLSGMRSKLSTLPTLGKRK